MNQFIFATCKRISEADITIQQSSRHLILNEMGVVRPSQTALADREQNENC
jgi:hypothetical protein